MATVNPFDLLGDEDSDDLSQLIAAQQQKIVAKKVATPPPDVPSLAKMTSKLLPPSQAVREAKSNTAAPRGRGREGRCGDTGQSCNFWNENGNGSARSVGGSGSRGGGGGGEDGDSGRPSRGPYGGPRQPFRGGHYGGFGNGEFGGDTERPRRTFERRSGTGRGYEMKRDGAGRGNWGSVTDDSFGQETEGNMNIDENIASPEKQPDQEDATLTETGKENKEGQTNEAEEKEKEDKEMTLEEYTKIREEKRKTLFALKTEERKVEIDKELKCMQPLKKEYDVIFIKLGSDKEKKKESTEKDEKAKKSLSINEFLKPAESERYYSPGSRGRGRGRGDGRSFRGGFGGGANTSLASAPSIEDPRQFPTLGGK